MSFEGHEQCICINGHYFEYDVYLKTGCDTCGKPAAWTNLVDDTNCDSAGEIPMGVLITHFGIGVDSTGEGVFRIPTNEETNPLQHYRPHDGDTDDMGIPKLVPINAKTPQRGRRRKHR